MTAEEIILEKNVQAFIDKMQGTIIDRILLSIDTDPAFHKASVPFQCDYSYFAIFITKNGDFRIIPAATSEGTETFWVEEVHDESKVNKVIEVNSILKHISLERGKHFNYPFKMSLQFDNKELFFYCGEIYENGDGTLKYTYYDEMIMFFDNRQEALMFETLLNYD